MKRWNWWALLCMCCLLTSCYNTDESRENVLKVYNWADYIGEGVLEDFQQYYKEQTGEDIRIVYQTFDINEIMLTKIEKGHEDFDVVCPSEYIIERMLHKGLLLPIDTVFAHSPNYMKGVAPYIRQQIDKLTIPGKPSANRYAVCYMWGTAGLLYNKKYVSAQDLHSWGCLWDKRYAGKILMKDSYRDAVCPSRRFERQYPQCGQLDERLFTGLYGFGGKVPETAETQCGRLGSRFWKRDDDQGQGLDEHDLERRCPVGY